MASKDNVANHPLVDEEGVSQAALSSYDITILELNAKLAKLEEQSTINQEEHALLTRRLDDLYEREREFSRVVSGAYGELISRNQELERTIASVHATVMPAFPNQPGHGQSSPALRLTAAQYRELVERCGEWADTVIPPGATVAVISKGDEALLQLGGRTAWHFPRGAGGRYAGHYPADSAGAIAHLEEVRAAGAAFLLLPRTAFWWLEHYAGFAQHLAQHYQVVERQDDVGLIYALGSSVNGVS